MLCACAPAAAAVAAAAAAAAVAAAAVAAAAVAAAAVAAATVPYESGREKTNKELNSILIKHKNSPGPTDIPQWVVIEHVVCQRNKALNWKSRHF